MRREIIFDTETTGLDNGVDRIIEIGAVELVNLFPSGRNFHAYVNPAGRAVHPDALAIHGITDAFLADKPGFADIAEDFVTFTQDARLVAHNAGFDIGFLNAEFERLSLAPIAPERVTDTLSLARRRHPTGPNSLDALCRRYGIDNAHRTKHGALLDAELLAEVYIEMVAGRQAALGLTQDSDLPGEGHGGKPLTPLGARPVSLPSRLSKRDIEAHQALVGQLGEKAIWNSFRKD